MKTGKITAKLRDTVPVCLMVEGKEIKRYKNIDLPDMLKEIEMPDFHFNVPEDGKITFEISYVPGVLPEVFPEPRAKMTRAEKAAAKAAAKTAAGNFIGTTPVYMKAPTYDFAVSNYSIDKNETLIGENNKALVETLAEQGFPAA